MVKKKILFVIPNLCHGGTNRVLENVLSLVNKDLFEISVLCFSDYKQSDPYYEIFSDQVRVHFLTELVPGPFVKLIINRFAAKLYYYFRILFNQVGPLGYLYKQSCAYVEEKIKPDTVVGFEEGDCTFFCSYFKCKKIAWVHSDYKTYINLRKPVLSYEYKCYRKFSAIVCVSKYTSESFVDVFRELENSVRYIYNPINDEHIRECAKEEIDDSFFQNECFTILSVGRYAEVKQFQLIPDIISKIRSIDSRVKFKWYIIGDGQSGLIKETKEKIKKYGIEDKLVLLGARFNPYPYMASSDLYVCTSYTEAYPCVINEAKVLGLPVLTNAFPSSREVINESNGIISSFESIPLNIISLIKNEGNVYNQKKNCILLNSNANIVKEIEVLLL